MAVAALLNGLSGVTFLRSPENDFDVDELPGLALWMGDQVTEDGETTFIAHHKAEAMIAGTVSGVNGAAAETAANDLYGRVIIAVMADPTLGGLAVNTRETGMLIVNNQDDEGRKTLAGFELSLEVEFWTHAGDPTALAP